MKKTMQIQLKDHNASKSEAVPLRLSCDVTSNVDRVNPWSVIKTLERQLAITAEERNAARTALSQAIEQRADFFAQLSHEWRTPLNAILGYADLLRSVSENPQRTKRAADSIHEAGEHLLSMVEAVLDMAKLRTGTFELQDSDVSIHDICQKAIGICSGQASARGVLIATRLNDHLPIIRGDARVLCQILINLLSNAVKVAPPNTVVTLAAKRASKGRVSLSVEDCGPGIPADALERIMQPFEQLDPVRDAKTGTGLGLSLVRAFTELHDGQFQIISDVGHGTKMVVILPSARVVKPARHGEQHEFRFTRTGG